MNRVVFLLLALICISILLACGGGSDEMAPHERMNGTWVSAIMTVTFDFDTETCKGIYRGMFGYQTPFERSLALIEEETNLVTVKVDDELVVCRIHEGGYAITCTVPPEDDPSVIVVPLVLRRD